MKYVSVLTGLPAEWDSSAYGLFIQPKEDQELRAKQSYKLPTF